MGRLGVNVFLAMKKTETDFKRKRHEHKLYRRRDVPGANWYLDIFKDGKRVRQSLKTPVLREAKELRDAILAGERDLRFPRSVKDVSFTDLWAKYERWAKDHLSATSLDRARINWDQFTAFVTGTTTATGLARVTIEHLEAFKVHLQSDKEQSNRTVNDAMVRLGAIYARAIKQGWYKGDNPFSIVERLPVEETPHSFLTAAERDKILEAAGEYSQDTMLFVALCAFAGLRFKEAVYARWEWLDFAQGTLTVQGADDGSFGTKGKRFRTVPLHKRLWAILEPLKQVDGYIIAREKTKAGKWRVRFEPRRGFAFAVDKAERELYPDRYEDDGKGARRMKGSWCTPHTLRHTFASLLVQSGVSDFKVADFLGHRDTRTTRIYSHLRGRDPDIDRME